MKQLPILFAAALAATAFACQNLHHEGDDDAQEIALSAVPANVMAAAQGAVPGFVAEEACTEQEDGRLVYCLEGEADGKEVEVDVAADGKVIEVETEDEENEEDEEDDD